MKVKIMAEPRIDILKIDDRGRLVIPDEIRIEFQISEKAFLIGIGKPDERQVSLTSLSESRDTATFLLDSATLPKDYEDSLSDLADKLWGLQPIILKSGKSTREMKKMIKDTIGQLREKLPKDYEIKTVIMEENGRFVMPKIYRKILNLADQSYIICISDSDKKEMQLFPFIGAKHLQTLKRETKNGIEWLIQPSSNPSVQNSEKNPFSPI
jgi:bifunctional DNA-binding transcriptional regulator/antitoxin component of YhaV-PrlF toxin-antitoxin module